MPGRVTSWPTGWPSFTLEDNNPADTYQSDLKKQIIAQYGEDALKQAWGKTCRALDASMARIAKQGSAAIPIYTFDQIFGTENRTIVNEMKAAGCFIVRDVIQGKEANKLFGELEEFVSNNKGTITGWPASNPAIFHLYSSPVQLKLRTHPNQLKIQRFINSLFSDANCDGQAEIEAQYEPILYPDALRIRQPGQEFFGLGPHIDGGSLSRWADPEYLKVYDRIFSGHPEAYDPYDLTHRRNANPALFPSGVHASTLRNFQGWTALTSCGPGEGGLMLLPDIKVMTAYMMLRPFFSQPEEPGEWREADKWTIDNGETAWFPGTRRWDSQLLSLESHPHLNMEKTLVSMPEMRPGDTIWWHADVSADPRRSSLEY